MKTLIVQSYRNHNVPAWIARCMASVRAWATEQGFDYQVAGDDSFALCGADYLAAVGDNVRSITNLSRLILVQRAHAAGYERAVWLDADIFVFAPEQLRIELTSRYGFAREAWLMRGEDDRWTAAEGVNNSVFACMAGEPDLAWLIGALRHVALHRRIESNYQVGGDFIKGLRASLAFEALEHFGMYSADVVRALARGETLALHAQARFQGAPVYAANLCAAPRYVPPVGEAEALAAMDALERTRGEIVNAWVAEGKLQAQPSPGVTYFWLSQTGAA
ncbi:MAG TPA: hypothetical protein VGL58_11325 [Caulobacteraceae bacterium]|jgi:hypothetical protein